MGGDAQGLRPHGAVRAPRDARHPTARRQVVAQPAVRLPPKLPRRARVRARGHPYAPTYQHPPTHLPPDPFFWKKFYKKVGKIDVLLDDGGHKNIQQITSFMESYNNINQNGVIVVEDTHTSYMKKKGFKNPSKYSFINFCNLIIENLHRRNPSANKSLNILSKKIDSIYFYDSIVSINFGQFKKLNQTRLLENNKKLRNYFIDFRHKGNFIKTINKFEKSFGKIDESSITYKLIRKLFHRNPLITMKEKRRIKKYQKILKL